MENKNKLIILTILIIIVVLGGALELYTFGLSGKAISNQETIDIGAPLTLSGKLASFGVDIKKGIDLAVSEVNQKGDYKLNILYDDTQSDTTTAVTTVKRMIETENIKILIGPLASADVLASMPITEENKIILFTPISGSEDIKGKYVFKNRESTLLHGKRMAEVLYEKGIRKVAVLSANAANSITYKSSFIARFKELGGQVVYTADYDTKNTDFKTDITKLKESDAEAVYICPNSGVDGALIVKQLRELNFQGLIAGATALESKEFLTGASSSAEGVMFTTAFFDVNSEQAKEYNLKFKSLYASDSGPFAANAYDAVYLLKEAVEFCKGDNSDCITNYLHTKVKNYRGVGGETTFDKTGNVIKPVRVKVVENGKFVNYN
jgi:branched-chain amino acid transport system substrate-binding protein